MITIAALTHTIAALSAASATYSHLGKAEAIGSFRGLGKRFLEKHEGVDGANFDADANAKAKGRELQSVAGYYVDYASGGCVFGIPLHGASRTFNTVDKCEVSLGHGITPGSTEVGFYSNWDIGLCEEGTPVPGASPLYPTYLECCLAMNHGKDLSGCYNYQASDALNEKWYPDWTLDYQDGVCLYGAAPSGRPTYDTQEDCCLGRYRKQIRGTCFLDMYGIGQSTEAPTECQLICPPTISPTTSPTGTPTTSPTNSPSTSPTNSPSTSPTKNPSTSPTSSPTKNPSTSPSKSPSTSPSTSPTKNPSTSPTKNPTDSPSISPTKNPSTSPTSSPTKNPSVSPSTASPSISPTKNPTASPSTSPTSSPSTSPTTDAPSKSPTRGPTKSPAPPTPSPVAPPPPLTPQPMVCTKAIECTTLNWSAASPIPCDADTGANDRDDYACRNVTP